MLSVTNKSFMVSVVSITTVSINTISIMTLCITTLTIMTHTHTHSTVTFSKTVNKMRHLTLVFSFFYMSVICEV